MSAPPAAPSRELLLSALHEGYQGPAWHGPSLRSALRGTSAEEAAWRPGPGRNSIWELALHTAYARHRALRRLGAPGGRFPYTLRTAWWPRLPDALTPAAWRADLALLEDYQRQLVDALSTVPASRLREPRRRTGRTLGGELLGIAFHDVYHAGQIRLIKRLRG